MNVLKPANEEERLKALWEHNLLDTPPEQVFDNVVRLAKEICQVPNVLISLIDRDRQWFKAKIGFKDLSETPRDLAFCAHTILQSEPLIIPDAQLDERFATNPLVINDPKIRFYAGIPLTTQEGYALGTLCVIDYQPRELTPEQIQSLKDLGRQAMVELQRRRAIALRFNKTIEGKQEQKKFFGQLIGWFGFASAIVMGIGFISFWSSLQSLQIRQQVSHTLKVISNIESLNSHITDTQRASRGYVITAQAWYLNPYYRAVAQIDPKIQKLSELTADNPQQQAHLRALKPLTQAVMVTMQQIISTRQTKGFVPAAEMIKNGDGNELMEQIHALLTKMKLEEERLLSLRSAQAATRSQIEIVSIAVSTLILLVIVAAIYRLVHQEMRRRRQAEEQKEEQRELLEVTLTSVGDAMIAVDRDGHVTFMNPVAEAFTGWSNQQAQGLHFREIFRIINTNTGELLKVPFEEVLRTRRMQGLSVDTGLVHRNGQVIPIDDSCAPILSKNGVLQGAVMVFRDITEQKYVEAEIRRALLKERELSQLKSSFISMASHEFRTPLATILSSTELLERPSLKTTEERRKRYFRQIYTAIQRMQDLLNDVLVISTSESGKLKYEPELLNVDDFCRNLVEALQTSASSTHEIIFINKSNCQNAYMDQKLLQRIFTNLLSNAVKYSPQGGQVCFELEVQENQGIFRVRDQGIGIPPEELGRLFSSFNRASNVGNIPGTGLGLSIVKTCVDLHLGEIYVSSNLEQGTTFTVQLPLGQELLNPIVTQEPSTSD